MKTTVFFTLQFEGIHCWPACPIPEVSYLKAPHRHIFHVKGEAEVSHSDRDKEFIMLKKQVAEYLAAKFRAGDMGSTSCEMVAEDLVYVFDLVQCEVSEDGENGAIVRRGVPEPELSIQDTSADRYADPSEGVRTHWTGDEVEGRLKGVPTLFLSKLCVPALDVVHPHVFLCPTIIQDCDPVEVEKYAVSLLSKSIQVTLAVKPKDLPRVTPYLRVSAHIMVDIDLHGATWLKPTDSVKVETDFYTTLTATVGDMIPTTPKDYANDK